MSKAALTAIAKKRPTQKCICGHSEQWHLPHGKKPCTYPQCSCVHASYEDPE